MNSILYVMVVLVSFECIASNYVASQKSCNSFIECYPNGHCVTDPTFPKICQTITSTCPDNIICGSDPSHWICVEEPSEDGYRCLCKTGYVYYGGNCIPAY